MKVTHATTTSIYGHVIDASTGEHLPYATISIDNTTIGVTANDSGHFELKSLTPGSYTIVTSMIGYEDFVRTIKIEAGEHIDLNVRLEPHTLNVDEVVVSANRVETKRREAPALVQVLDNKVFEQSGATCLAEGLPFQPGVRIEDDCQNCGFAQVRINGLDGSYSQILIDSHPVFSALTGVYGLEQIPASMIERVEVLRGGGSALFGSSAVGGTINIITREPMHNSAQLSHTTMAIGNTGALDNNTMFNAAIVSDSKNAGISFYGQSRQRDGYDHNGDGFTEIPTLSNTSWGTRAYFRTSDYSRITVQYHHISEFRRGGDQMDRPAHEALIAEQVDHTIDGGSVSYSVSSADNRNRFNTYLSFQNTARESYYGSQMDLLAYGTTDDLMAAAGAQFTHSFDKLLFMPSDLTLGLEYQHNDLHDLSLGYDINTEQLVKNAGFYFQNEWKSTKWSLLLGARLDKHNMVSDPIFSPRLNLRFNPTESINFRASYAAGYRAPQAFDEDLHISIVGGERVRIALADDLKQERSHSLSLSADTYFNIGGVQTNLMVEGFYTMLDDVFALRELASTPEGKTMERYNGSGATVRGVNFEGRAPISRAVNLQAGFTVQKSTYNEAEYWSEDPDVAPTKEMFRSPSTYGYITLNLEPARNFGIDLSGTYTGSMLTPHMVGSGVQKDVAVETPELFNLNIRFSYDIALFNDINMEIHAGMQNIFNAYQDDFDKGVDRDSGYIYGPALPRSIVGGVKFSF